MADFTALIALTPKSPSALVCRGQAHLARGDHTQALADFNAAIAVDRLYVHAYHGRGLVHAATQNFDQAVVDHIEAIRLCPKSPEAYANFARFWASCPDRERRNGLMAVEVATRACELTDWADADSLAVLAAGHAEHGDLQQALEWAGRALDAAPPQQKWRFQVELENYQKRLRNGDGKETFI